MLRYKEQDFGKVLSPTKFLPTRPYYSLGEKESERVRSYPPDCLDKAYFDSLISSPSRAETLQCPFSCNENEDTTCTANSFIVL